MIQVLNNWGDDEELKNVRKWRKQNAIGYTLVSEFKVEHI